MVEVRTNNLILNPPASPLLFPLLFIKILIKSKASHKASTYIFTCRYSTVTLSAKLILLLFFLIAHAISMLQNRSWSVFHSAIHISCMIIYVGVDLASLLIKSWFSVRNLVVFYIHQITLIFVKFRMSSINIFRICQSKLNNVNILSEWYLYNNIKWYSSPIHLIYIHIFKFVNFRNRIYLRLSY